MNTRHFVVCIRNDGADDLQVRKLYRVLPDPKAAAVSYLRIVDESGEDYLYPSTYFAEVEVSPEAAEALAAQ